VTLKNKKAEDVVAKVNKQMGTVVEVNKASKKELPPLAYYHRGCSNASNSYGASRKRYTG
jgi:DNA topoisomerase IA